MSLLQVPGLVNVDFADVRAVMTNAGSSLMGQGRASGQDRWAGAAAAVLCRVNATDRTSFTCKAVESAAGEADLGLVVEHAMQAYSSADAL